MKFLTSRQIKTAEEKIITGVESSLSLINNAAEACVKELLPFDASCVFCGKGNNGADGYRIAALLKSLGKRVRIAAVFPPRTEECKRLCEACRESGIEIVPFFELKEIERGEVIVDAIFGIGIKGEVMGEARDAIERINAARNYVLSVDVPSGLDADSGKPCGVAVKADKTVTLTAPKAGMLSNESVDFCGEIIVREAGIPVDYDALPAAPQPLLAEAVRLPRRPRLSHKGTFGRLLMLVGSPGMAGAAIMSARAAVRSGCGLATIVCKKGMENLFNLAVPEAVALPTEEYSLASSERLSRAVTSADAILIGCGSGKSLSAEFIGSVIEACDCPVVLDADGLNALAGRTEMLKGKNLVITPHPLEFSRLSGKTVAEIEADRIKNAADFAREYGAAVLLKGARTVIANERGEIFVSLTATSALARGGAGDVLAGIIAALCAQGLSPFEAAKAGVYLHGRSGMLCAEKCGEYSATISDITENLKYAFKELERQ